MSPRGLVQLALAFCTSTSGEVSREVTLFSPQMVHLLQPIWTCFPIFCPWCK